MSGRKGSLDRLFVSAVEYKATGAGNALIR